MKKKTEKSAHKERNQAGRISTAKEKKTSALREAGIPETRWQDDTSADSALSDVLYEGRPALVDDNMADDAAPEPYTHHRRNVPVTEIAPCTPCKGTGKLRSDTSKECSWCNGTGEVNMVIEPAGAYIAPTAVGQRPSFYMVSRHVHRQLRALGSLKPTMPKTKKVIEMPKGQIKPRAIEITGLGRGGVASFRRSPNPTLKRYLARNYITLKQYDAALHLYLVFEDASIPGGTVIDPTRDFSGGGGWRDFMPHRLDSHRRLEVLFSAISGKLGKQMIFDVCCHGKLLNENTYPPFTRPNEVMARFREAMEELRIAVERNPR